MKLLVAFVALLIGGAVMAREMPMEVVGTDGVKLAGTLTLPDTGPAKAPALLLIQGSGPTDRDGNSRLISTPIDTLRAIAEALAADGVATLRLDKRGQHANAASLPTEPTQFAQFLRWDAYVGDWTNALHALAARPDIDPRRVGIAGHSEGGMVALAIAASERAPAPRAMLLLATNGRPMTEVLHEQIGYLMERQGASEPVRTDMLAKLDSIMASVSATSRVPDDVPPGLRFIFQPALGAFLGPWLSQQPAALARRYAGPVLILQGANDLQVSSTRDAPALAEAFRARGGQAITELRVLPNVSHVLKPVANEQDPGFAGTMAPAALDAIRSFVKERL